MIERTTKNILTPALLACVLLISGCQTMPSPSGDATAVQSQGPSASGTVRFIDYPGFDRDLHQALTLEAPVVTVLLYDKVSPNNTPDRIQKWLNAVDKHGGKVEVQPPPNELTPKNPLLLISLIGGLWNVIKASADLRDSQLTRIVKGHDAVISLERNDAGQVVIAKILFRKSPDSPKS